MTGAGEPATHPLAPCGDDGPGRGLRTPTAFQKRIASRRSRLLICTGRDGGSSYIRSGGRQTDSKGWDSATGGSGTSRVYGRRCPD